MAVAIGRAGVYVYSSKICRASDGAAAGTAARIPNYEVFFSPSSLTTTFVKN